MEALKENTNLKYYESTKNYCLFLLDKITNDDKYLQGKSISKENYHMATLSIISSMFFEMKEDLIEKKDGNIKFKSTLLSNTKTAIKYLAKYENGKYIIDNFAFNDELTLFNTIRNKLAHGDFVIDEVPSRIIINVNGNKVRIRVEDLTNFVVSLFKSCFTIKDNNTYERNILFNPCKIQSRSEIRNYLKAFSKCKITLKSKNNTLEDEVIKKLDKVIKEYEITNNINLLFDFRDSIKENYEFLITNDKLYNSISKEFLNNIYKMIDPKMDLDTQMEVINALLSVNLYNNGLNHTYSNINNLIILNSWYKCHTNNFNVIEQDIFNTYKRIICIKNEELLQASISMFISLFSYFNDNKLSNDFNFASLDLSSFDIMYKEDEAEYKEILIKYNSLQKVFNEKQVKLNKQKENIINLEKKDINKAKQIYENTVLKLEEEIKSLQKELDILKDKILNEKYYMNKYIINSIRNSIAHGNYTVSNIKSYDEAVVEFSDIYEDKLTFKAKIKLTNFIQMIFDNQDKIIDKNSKVVLK